jgi:hypothetical protein
VIDVHVLGVRSANRSFLNYLNVDGQLAPAARGASAAARQKQMRARGQVCQSLIFELLECGWTARGFLPVVMQRRRGSSDIGQGLKLRGRAVKDGLWQWMDRGSCAARSGCKCWLDLVNVEWRNNESRGPAMRHL